MSFFPRPIPGARWRLVLLLSGAICALVLRSPAAVDFEQANTLFDQQQYAEARAVYAELEKQGPRTANLAYNLGNTEFRLSAPGRAILQYERALRLDPAHREARANLDFARKQTGAQLLASHWADLAVPPWPAWVTVAAASLAGWLILFALAGLFLAPAQARLRCLVALVAGLLLGSWAGIVLWRLSLRDAVAIVLQPAAEARTAPADRASQVEALAAGSQVRVLGERGAWTYCELPQGKLGWLPTNLLGRVGREG